MFQVITFRQIPYVIR